MRNLTIAETQAIGGGETSMSTIAGAAFGGVCMFPFGVWRGTAMAVTFGGGLGTSLLGFGLVLGTYVVGGALVGAAIGSGLGNMLGKQ